MSADNGIYIGVFPAIEGGKEFRVVDEQAINNCEDDPNYTQDLIDNYRVVYFKGKKAKVFKNMSNAMHYARQLEREYCKEGWVLEYGISTIIYDRPLLHKTAEDAEKWLNNYWDIMR